MSNASCSAPCGSSSLPVGARCAAAFAILWLVCVAGCASTRVVAISSDRPARIALDGEVRCDSTPCEVEVASDKEVTLRAEPLEGDERPIDVQVSSGLHADGFALFACCLMPPASLVTGLVGLALSPGSLATPGLALCWVPGSIGVLCGTVIWPIIGVSVALIGASTHLKVLRIDFSRREVHTSPSGYPAVVDGKRINDGW